MKDLNPTGLAQRDLERALVRAAEGRYSSEAAARLLLDHGLWLRRKDFVRAAVEAWADNNIVFASIRWDRVPGLRLPASGSEIRILDIAASIAGANGVDLREALSNLDQTSTRLVLRSIALAAGHRNLAVTL